MSESRIIAKVFLAPNHELHIITHCNQMVYATVLNLLELFSTPKEFINFGIKQYNKSNYQLGIKSPCFDVIYGPEVASVSEDSTITIKYPFLFEVIINRMKKRMKEIPDFELNILDFIDYSYITDDFLKMISVLIPSEKSPLNSYPVIEDYHNKSSKFATLVHEIMCGRNNASLAKQEKIVQMDLLPPSNVRKFTDYSKEIQTQDTPQDYEVDYLVIKDFAKQNNLKESTVKTYAAEGRYKSAYKNKDGIVVIHKDDKPIKKEKQNKPKSSGKSWSVTSKDKNATYKEVQECIIYNKYFSDTARSFIKTMTELNYYLSNQYKEVFLIGRPTFIIDINPDYIIKGENKYSGKTNRELIKMNRSPIVPGSENGDSFEQYELHHVGQTKKPTAPYAIIPSDDHHKNHFEYFHDGSSGEDLHDAEFEFEKKSFWQNYIREYDKYKCFEDIPHVNEIITDKRILDELRKKIGLESPRAS